MQLKKLFKKSEESHDRMQMVIKESNCIANAWNKLTGRVGWKIADLNNFWNE